MDQNLHSDPWDKHRAPSIPRPMLCNARPTGTSFVELSLPVPVKLNLHPPVFVRVYLFATLANDGRGLAGQYHRLWSRLLRTEGRRPLAPTYAFEGIRIAA